MPKEAAENQAKTPSRNRAEIGTLDVRATINEHYSPVLMPRCPVVLDRIHTEPASTAMPRLTSDPANEFFG
jgi:hypothetical protein